MIRIISVASAVALSASFAFAAMSDRPDMLPNVANTASESAITAQLKTLGYQDISDVRLSGDIYTAEAEWDGHPVSLRINRTLGEIRNADAGGGPVVGVEPGMSADEFTAALAAKGYTNVRDVRLSGNVYRATADRDGHGYRLRVDAQTGEVTTHADRTGLAIPPTDGLSSSEIEHQLKDIGFVNPQVTAQHGQVVAATAKWKGEPVHLRIDAPTGIVTIEG